MFPITRLMVIYRVSSIDECRALESRRFNATRTVYGAPSFVVPEASIYFVIVRPWPFVYSIFCAASCLCVISILHVAFVFGVVGTFYEYGFYSASSFYFLCRLYFLCKFYFMRDFYFLCSFHFLYSFYFVYSCSAA